MAGVVYKFKTKSPPSSQKEREAARQQAKDSLVAKVLAPEPQQPGVPADIAELLANGGQLSHSDVLQAIDGALRTNNIRFFIELSHLLEARERKRKEPP